MVTARISQIDKMIATSINGTEVARQLEAEIKQEVDILKQKVSRPPGLGVILVGDNPASKYYVATKEKVAKRAGLESFETLLPATASMEEVEAVIEKYNRDSRIDGILLQLPVPKHLNSDRLLDLIDPNKDADGLHPVNQGLLMTGKHGVRPCTPSGVMKLIDVALANGERADLSGKRAVVLGRSILVGKPVALILLERNATVTVAHSKTADIESVAREADILVAAIGKPEFVKGSWIKPGAIVIDVGINRLSDGKLVGDVAYSEAVKIAKAITPVPAGVGPMTVVMLIANTLRNFKRLNGL